MKEGYRANSLTQTQWFTEFILKDTATDHMAVMGIKCGYPWTDSNQMDTLQPHFSLTNVINWPETGKKMDNNLPLCTRYFVLACFFRVPQAHVIFLFKSWMGRFILLSYLFAKYEATASSQLA